MRAAPDGAAVLSIGIRDENMDNNRKNTEPVRRPASAPEASAVAAPVVAAPVVAPASKTVRVRLKPGAAILTAGGRKVGGDWIEADVRDMAIPRWRANVETAEDIEAAKLPQKQRDEQQAVAQALFSRFVESEVKAAAREKEIRGPLLEAMTPQGPAPAPARIG